jgi:hypothetical protein
VYNLKTFLFHKGCEIYAKKYARRNAKRLPCKSGIIADINNSYKGLLKDISAGVFSLRYADDD